MMILPCFRGDPKLWGTFFGRKGNYGLGRTCIRMHWVQCSLTCVVKVEYQNSLDDHPDQGSTPTAKKTKTIRLSLIAPSFPEKVTPDDEYRRETPGDTEAGDHGGLPAETSEICLLYTSRCV